MGAIPKVLGLWLRVGSFAETRFSCWLKEDANSCGKECNLHQLNNAGMSF